MNPRVRSAENSGAVTLGSGRCTLKRLSPSVSVASCFVRAPCSLGPRVEFRYSLRRMTMPQKKKKKKTFSRRKRKTRGEAGTRV